MVDLGWTGPGYAADAALRAAGGTPDPELPLLTILDLGILRQVLVSDVGVTVIITPTYSGCPAMPEISADITRRLARAGFAAVTVQTQLAPPWTSDWITADGRRKLAEAGIAPPTRARAPGAPRRAGPVPLTLGSAPPVRCPRCGSARTELIAQFSATACKSLRRLRRAVRGGEAPVMERSALESTVAAGAGAVLSRSGFHPLVVAQVERLTSDSAAITFTVPAGLAGAFAFAAGQFLTVRRGSGDERRSYSICAPVGAPPRIAVRELPGGALSGWLVHQVRPGDTVDVQVPAGTFTLDLGQHGRHVLIAAGSGITPLMSIAASVLAADDESTVTLLYGNRRSDTVMFADEVADLKDACTARLSVIHVLSREPQEVELFSGRLDRERLTALLPAVVDAASVDQWWLCGPFDMITGAVEVLRGFGVPSARIHRELFWVGDEPPAAAAHADAPAGPGASVTVILDGRRSTLTLPPGTPILDGAQRVRPDLPFACKGGVCGTCRARVTSGAATMRRNFALEEAETARGYVLTCQAIPQTEEVTVDYDR